jgi:hypothetical protein
MIYRERDLDAATGCKARLRFISAARQMLE